MLAAFTVLPGFQTPPTSHLDDPFATGWLLTDTNGDGVADAVAGKVVVPANSSAAENAAAANIAARIGYGTTGLTPPLVVAGESGGPQIRVGGRVDPSLEWILEAGEGVVAAVDGNLALWGKDDDGLMAAAEALASRSPYIWKVPGERLAAIAAAVNESAPGAGARLTALSFVKAKAGVQRAFLTAGGAVTAEQLEKALANPKLASVYELRVGGAVARASKPLAAIAPAAGAGAAAAGADAAGGPPAPLDLAALYKPGGLFRGTPRMPVPSTLDSQLIVPAGAAGVAMANLAARMGLETTGITLPLAIPDTSAKPREIRTKAVVAETSEAGREAERRLREEDVVAGEAEAGLAAGDGELRIVDKAFGRQSAVLVRGDERGAAAALGLLSDHLPNIWEPGKQYGSIEEMRFDLHRFFSLRSAAGQATAALYRLDKWMAEIKKTGPVKDVEAGVFVDIADAGLDGIVSRQIEAGLNVKAKVKTGSLHAGTQCCAKLPALHYKEPGYRFEPGTPTFAEDLVIPWEGTRLLQAVKGALAKLKQGEAVSLTARVSEGPEQRRKLSRQLSDMIAKAGGKPAKVSVLSAYKPGFSWLMDEIAPELKGKGAASMKIEFKKNTDPTGMRVMYSPARWVHELYPVDEALARELSIPLDKIELAMFEGSAKAPHYRVQAFDAAGKPLLNREFTVTTVLQPYNGVMKSYEQVEVDTGWVRMESGGAVVLDQRIRTDIEEFWDHYQNKTLPAVHRAILAQSHGEVRPEYAPAFDTLKIDIHMSEPEIELGIDKERISSLEALQEDTFYSTENFINMIGELQAGRPIVHVGRVIPIVHAPEDGKDGRVRIEFYLKPAANPMVELKWTDAQGKTHEKHRDLPALTGTLQPRLIQARTQAGAAGPSSLTWMLDADFRDDRFEEWVQLESQNQVEHNIFPAEQAKGQLRWLEKLQQAGLYNNDLRYPYVKRMRMEFQMPRPLTARVDSAAPRDFFEWSAGAPVYPRPMAKDFAPRLTRRQLVQWDEPVPPSENAAVLGKLGENPGVSVYWMGRSYLGEDLWAADLMSPSPSLLRSWAKESTLKASIIYSGRQHANEVSSTSHILKLGDQLVNDAATRAMLRQVNVVLHPITNPDGAELSVQLAEITPNNMLHPGYHGALAADVSVGQRDVDPLYPESRTRKQLQDAWLPDVFLNPHGYPSHEWVQPFSEYSGWVQSRQGANPGRGWWIPRGWFTSLGYSRDPNQPYSEKIAYEIRDRIADAQNAVPGLMELEGRMNARYQRFGQKWQPRDMQQPLTKGVRIYMGLKGSSGPRGGGAEAGSADITWNSGYTEAPDETAHGDYMKLLASAGLAFDMVHLKYLAEGKLRIQRTEREQAGKVVWSVQRLRPNLPAGEPEPPRPDAPATNAGSQ